MTKGKHKDKTLDHIMEKIIIPTTPPKTSTGQIDKNKITELDRKHTYFKPIAGDQVKRGFIQRGRRFYCTACVELWANNRMSAADLTPFLKSNDSNTNGRGKHVAVKHQNHDIAQHWESFVVKRKLFEAKRSEMKFGKPQDRKIHDYFSPSKDRTTSTLSGIEMSYNKETWLSLLTDWAICSTGSLRNFTIHEGKVAIAYLDHRAALDFPCTKTMKNLLLNEFDSTVTKIESLLSECKYKISIMIDGWTNRRMHGFLAVQVRFVTTQDRNVKLQSILLDLVPTSTHTAAEMYLEISKVLKRYKIEHSSISAFVVDNASANTLLVDHFNQQKVDQTGKIISERTQTVYCLAHCLHRVVTSMLAVLDHQLRDVRSLVRIINNSSKKQEDLETFIACYNTMNKKRPILKTKLPTDVSTRWNSTYFLLQVACEMRDPLSNLCNKHVDLKFGCSINYEMLQSICTFLSSFNSYQLQASIDKHSTIGMVFITYNNLLLQLEKESKKISDEKWAAVLPSLRVTLRKALCKDLLETHKRQVARNLTADEIDSLESVLLENKTQMFNPDQIICEAEVEIRKTYLRLIRKVFKSKGKDRAVSVDYRSLNSQEAVGAAARAGYMLLKKHYNNISDYHVAAAILDPRFNLAFTKNAVQLQDEDLEAYVFPPLRRLYEETKALGSVPEEDQEHKKLKLSPKDRRNVVPDYWNVLTSPQKNEKTELERYYEEDRIAFDDCPLQWWYEKRSKYPILSRLAIDALTISPTTVPVERIFSLANFICTPVRNKLQDQTIRVNVCLKTWFNMKKIVSKTTELEHKEVCDRSNTIPMDPDEEDKLQDQDCRIKPLSPQQQLLFELREAEDVLPFMNTFALSEYLEYKSSPFMMHVGYEQTKWIINAKEDQLEMQSRSNLLDRIAEAESCYFVWLQNSHFTAAVFTRGTKINQAKLQTLDPFMRNHMLWKPLHKKLEDRLQIKIKFIEQTVGAQRDGFSCGYRVAYYWDILSRMTMFEINSMSGADLALLLDDFEINTYKEKIISYLEITVG